MAYGNGNGNGSNGNGGDSVLNLPTGGGVVYSFIDSVYKFTDPPRYYKANDPYYYEVDNIPLKQIHENCLWLRDQITGQGGGLSVSGVTKRNIEDLKPAANGIDRFVTVQPGNFIGRVNDPTDYSHEGYFINTVTNDVDFEREGILAQPGYRITETQWKAIVDDITAENIGTSPFGTKSNGLYTYYTMHGTGSFANVGNGNTIVPLTPAMWKNIIAGREPQASSFQAGSADLDMAFRRRWSGVFRTAVVNVPNQLSIQIPPFEDADFIDNSTTLDPQVRIDLLCLYTVPVDRSTNTRILKNGSFDAINKSELVVVKGAGGIIASKNGAEDIASDPARISDILTQDYLNPKYYDTSGGLDGDASYAIKANLSDQLSDGSDPYASTGDALPMGSFPSPDDLLNIAPKIAEDVTAGSIQTVGQSVLPLAYIIVRKGMAAITNGDIIDIRPFMRTAELAYNERAGVGAANPPLSFANPAVGKAELYDALEQFKSYLDNQVGGGASQLGRGARPIYTSNWYQQQITGSQAAAGNETFIWYDPTSYDNAGLATADAAMSQVNGGDVFSPIAGAGLTGSLGVKVVRGRYLIKVNNTIYSSAHSAPHWNGNPQAFSEFKLRKTSSAGNTSDIFPPSNVGSNEDPWRVGPSTLSKISSFDVTPRSQSITLTCEQIFDLNDGDIIETTVSSSESAVAFIYCQGNISIERLPDNLIG